MRLLEVNLVRHAPSVHDEGVVPPRDPEADIGDSAAIKALASVLPPSAPWRVSPMLRCRMTAEALLKSGAEAREVVYDDRLIEQNCGDYHGMELDAVWERVKGGPRSDWHFLHHDHCPPEGESYAMLHERSRPVVDDMESGGTGGHLVVVSHSMMIRSLLAHALGLPLEQSLALAVENLSLTQLVLMAGEPEDGAAPAGRDGWNGRWKLKSMNRVFG